MYTFAVTRRLLGVGSSDHVSLERQRRPQAVILTPFKNTRDTYLPMRGPEGRTSSYQSVRCSSSSAP